jgi:hypothetical protein
MHSNLVENKKWNKGMGINLRAIEAISLHFIPCVGFHLQILISSVVYLKYETFEFPSFLLHPTTLSDYTSMVWMTCFRMEIIFLRWSNGSRSCIICWRIWRNSEERWQCQHESTNEQSFSTLPLDIMPLRLIEEGDQSKFLD